MNKYLEIIKQQQELINSLLNNSSKLQIENNQQINLKADIKGFIEFLTQKGLSQNSIDTYSNQVDLYFRKYKFINNENLAKYENDFRKFSPKTANIKIAAMSKYFKFINYKEYEFKRIKEQKKTFCDNAINEEQYKKFIEWTIKNKNTKAYLIAKIIANTGVRVSELVSLKTSDLDKGYVDIVGKGNKQRRIFFTKNLIQDVKNICGKHYIVENSKCEQYTTRAVAAVLHTAGINAGIPKEVMHPHSFRHYFAKQFLKQKNDITLLGDILGHSNISTTAIYTRLTSEEQQKEINKIVNW